MSGTIQGQVYATSPTEGYTSAPVATGDHLTWTLQYDPRSPLVVNKSESSIHGYTPTSPVISNLVDRTNGFHFLAPPASSLKSGLALFNFPMVGGTFTAGDFQLGPNNIIKYSTILSLIGPAQGFSTLDLAKLRLDQAGIQMTGPFGAVSQLSYFGSPTPAGGVEMNFQVQVTSLSGVTTPEPGTFTLCILGVLGLATRRIYRGPGPFLRYEVGF